MAVLSRDASGLLLILNAMQIKMKINIIILIFFIAMPAVISGQECTNEQARKSETIAAYLKTWDEVFGAWKDFKHCDDGAIAEGFSDSVTKILSEKWTENGHLIELIESNPQFEKFIVVHINRTVPRERLTAIRHLAKMQCINATPQFCLKVLERVKE
jgi:hypothetical protein